MFATLQTEIIDRIFRVRQFFLEACDPLKSPNSAAGSKGLVFVLLYAIYEYTLNQSVTAAMNALCGHKLGLQDVRLELLSVVLDPEICSAGTAGNEHKWDARCSLFGRLSSADPIKIPAKHFPNDGSHYRQRQLDTIWKLFGIAAPVLADVKHGSIIEELVEHRNAIAHGRETPGRIGGRYSAQDVEHRIKQTEAICLHVTATLQTHCASAANLRR